LSEIAIIVDAFMTSAYATKALLFSIIIGGVFAYKKIIKDVTYSIFFSKAVDSGFEKVIANGKGEQYAIERDKELNRLYDEEQKRKVNITSIKK